MTTTATRAVVPPVVRLPPAFVAALQPLPPRQRAELLDTSVASVYSALPHADATRSMPLFRLLLDGAQVFVAWIPGVGAGCRDPRLVQLQANGRPALARYRPDPDGGHVPRGVDVLDLSGGGVVRITSFTVPDLFPHVGLAPRLEPARR